MMVPRWLGALCMAVLFWSLTMILVPDLTHAAIAYVLGVLSAFAVRWVLES